jgi:D-glycero-alpha-D-manno-heptose-7-phosphate kinase
LIISRAPLRISFFGGGSDFPEYFREHGGRVLSTAIDRYNYITATPFPSRLFDYKIRLSYSRGELVHTTGEIQHPVFRACLELLDLRQDIELHAVADLPAFTGLGSSSSFTVTLLHALHAFKGEDVGPAVLAREAIRVEREILGECVGCQDQVAAAYGGFNLVEFSADADPVVRPLKIPVENLQKLQKGMLLVFTHLKRRAQEIEKSKLPKFAARSPELEEMKAAALEGVRLLESSRFSLKEFGNLLEQGWQRKKQLSPLVCPPEVEALHSQALKLGAYGGKLLGAGGGGFILFLAEPDQLSAMAQTFCEKEQIRPGLGAGGAKLIFQNTSGESS